ncbi:MAG: insulinase family protein [Bacteroidia bacterium]|nr:insulinase family protein [Bacteroidia bacterium]MCZ2140328.1 insulinase family protein [Bacteroidia bacterium]
MINFNKFTLSNGLEVIHHQDTNSKLCVLNLLYKVGSKDENPNKTGFAHLFEHLMFGGSVNVKEFDSELQMVGGENNAFTSNDITNYYITVPANNIETAFWLESDRMLSLDFNQKVLDTQKSVVIEEFKERYINPPYGDIWLKLLPLAYKQHPYKWPTIGKDFSHIENATLDDVKAFFYGFYAPNNAILVISGNIDLNKTKALTEKWFGPIPKRNLIKPTYPTEPRQTEKRTEKVYADVPLDAIVIGFHICHRLHPDFFACDMLTDILGGGKSSRLYNELLKNKKIFSEVDCYQTGDFEPGLIIIEGKLTEGITHEMAEKEVFEVINNLIKDGVDITEVEKIKNKTETNIRFNDVGVLSKAMKLAFATYYGDTNLANTEVEEYLKVSPENIQKAAETYLKPTNANVLYYFAKNATTK